MDGKRVMRIIKWAVGIDLAVVAAEYAMAYRMFNGFLLRKDDIYEDDMPADKNYSGRKYHKAYLAGIRENQKIKGEDVTITSDDGLELMGTWYPAENAKRTIILAHGYHSSWQKDFAGMVPWYHENGSNLLMIEERAHRRSEGTYITMGIRESEDIVKWAEFLNGRFGDALPLYFHGVSMGAATVLMSQGEILPPNMAGIIADCGFTSCYDISLTVVKRSMGLLAYPLLYRSNLYANRIAKIDMKEKENPKILAHAKIPTLFIHGTGDHFVPCDMTVKNYSAAACEKRLVLVEGAPHAMSWFYDTERYKKAVADFFEEHDA